MGSVKIDKDKNEYEWKVVNEATIDSIKGLLKYRYKYDPVHSAEDTNIYLDNEEYEINYEALHTYIDLDRHIKLANLNEYQKEILKLYESGKTENEIAEIINRNQKTINSVLNTICKKIYNEAKEEWKSYMNLDVIKTKYNYKKCTRCGEFKPIHIDYFRKRIDEKGDGFYNQCRKCEK